MNKALNDLIEALGILQKYAAMAEGENLGYVQPEHDELYVGSVEPARMDQKDKRRLKRLGWEYLESHEAWLRIY